MTNDEIVNLIHKAFPESYNIEVCTGGVSFIMNGRDWYATVEDGVIKSCWDVTQSVEEEEDDWEEYEEDYYL